MYIGFGSLVVGDPVKLTQYFVEAIQITGLRAIIQKGWGGLGAGLDEKCLPENVMLIGVAPHDWLFEKVNTDEAQVDATRGGNIIAPHSHPLDKKTCFDPPVAISVISRYLILSIPTVLCSRPSWRRWYHCLWPLHW